MTGKPTAIDGATFENRPEADRRRLVDLHNYLLTRGKPDDVPFDIWRTASAAAPDMRMSANPTEVVTDILGMMDDEIAVAVCRLLMAERATNEKIVDAARQWAEARCLTLQEETPDVRRSDSFRERLEALATAEQRLVSATTRKETAA